MNSQGKLVVNASYKDLFSEIVSNREDFFIFPEIEDLDAMENAVLTRSTALLLAEIDSAKGAKYGVEIKSNGSERSSRIPLVRISEKSASIWKIASDISSLEKTVVVLNDLFYFLKDHSDSKYPLPEKVIILKDSKFVLPDSDYMDFAEDLARLNNIFIFSFDFLKNKIRSGDKINFDLFFTNTDKRVITK